MIIQPLLFPKQEICPEQKMYFRKKENKISLETYFNAFSVGKWKTYTNIEDLYFEIESEQRLRFTCVHAVGHVSEEHDRTELMVQTEDPARYAVVSRRRIPFTVKRSGNRYRLTFGELPDEGIIYVNILLEKETADISEVLLSGGYGTDTEITQNPKIALGICTFKREEFLMRNVNLVLDHIIENPDNPLHKCFEVYVSDNGQTLASDCFDSDCVHVFPNINAGGAGGFTRCMIEALLRRKPSVFTHIILMDDDILLDTDVLERTWHLLSHIKPEHQEAIVGGEMFELDRRYMQYEAGAYTKWQTSDFYHRFYDMRKVDLVSANEADTPINYSGWWYNCIPAAVVREDNLPIPAFIHYDDMEYGVRHSENGLILINGICVWHPQAPNKASVSMAYYDMRNALIAEAATAKEQGSTLKMLGRLTLLAGVHTIDYRYGMADCILQGYEDFHRGPKAFMKIDPVEKHAELAKYNYKFVTPEEADIATPIKCKESMTPPWINGIVSFLCWALPSVKKTKVISAVSYEQPFMHKRIYVYDEDKGAGYVLLRDYRQAFRCFVRYLKDAVCVLLFFRRDKKKWYKVRKQYTSLDFWEKYLKIDQ